MTRNERQDIAIEKYRNTAIGTGVLRGTLNHCTGFGKTTETIKIINRIRERRGDIHCKIIVPTNPLKKQWEDRLEDDNHEVLTIQGIISNLEYYKNNKLKGFLIIIDEIHKFAAEQFSLIFTLIDNIDSTNLLGLTATWKRLDGKEEVLNKYCPVIDVITLEEARRNEWVADYMQYCWGIDFSDKDKEIYNNLHEQIESYMPYFEHDYNVMLGLCSRKDRKVKGMGELIGAETYIINNPGIEIYYQDKDGNEIRAIDFEEKVKALTTKANICRGLISKRKEYTSIALCKLEAVLEAIHYFNMKTVTFGGAFTSTADYLTDRLGDKARSYHTKLSTKILKVKNSKGKLIDRKVSGNKQCEMFLEDFINDVFLYFNTAKKADLGLDVPGLRLAIIYDRTSDPGTNDQRIGRVTRYEEITVDGELIIKDAIILQIYIKGTRDESNLKWLLKNSTRVRWIDSLDKIKI